MKKGLKLLLILVIFFVFSAAGLAEGINIAIAPENPTTNDELTCSINGQVNPSYIYKWSKEGDSVVVEDAVLSASYTSPGDTWTCKVYYPSWPIHILLGSASVTIPGGAPEPPTQVIITIEPAQPNDNSELTAKVNGVASSEYIYKWSKQGSSQVIEANPLAASYTSPGDTWRVRVYYPSWPVPIFIGEASVSIPEEVVPPTLIITIEPAYPFDNDELTAKVNGVVDSSYIYKWSKQGSSQVIEANPLAASYTAAGDVWTVKVYYPSWPSHILVGEASVTVQETPPPGIVNILPEDPKTDDNLRCTINNQGPYIFKWSKNNVYLREGVSVSAQETKKGETWSCKVYYPSWPTHVLIGEDSETILNSLPSITAIPNQEISVGEQFSYQVTANDIDVADGTDSLTFSIEGPTGMIISNSGLISWVAQTSQAGQTYNIGVRVIDNENAQATESFNLRVKVIPLFNQPPVLTPIGNKQVNEGQPLTFQIAATDPNNHALTYTVANLPTGAVFDANNQVFSWTPSYTQAGSYQVTFRVTDNGVPALSDSETITITVGNVNRAPVLASIGNKQVDENGALSFTITATDADNDDLVYSATNLPTGAVFDANTQTFTWTPSYEQAGSYAVTFTVTDNGVPALSASEAVNIVVNDVNRLPVLVQEPTGNQQVNEAQTLTVHFTATDPDNDSLTLDAYTTQEMISTADQLVVNDNPDGSWDFVYTPSYEAVQHPNPTTVFEVTLNLADGEAIIEQTFQITVNDVNQAPVLTPIGNQQVDENTTLSFTITATDPDGDTLTYSTSTLPTGASFDVATQTFSWTPTFQQAGTYPVTFSVSDSQLGVLETINISVSDVNQAPVLTPIGNKQVDENATLSFTVSATDADGNTLTYSATGLPTGASFDAATQTFTWTPTFQQTGNYQVTFIVTDNGVPALSASEMITVSVGDVNRPPVLASIGDKQINENIALTFTVAASDPDGDTLTYSTSVLPTGASFDVNTQTFSWTPTFQQAGTHQVNFSVSDGDLTDSELITIMVGNVNQAPVLTPIGNQQVGENETLTFTVAAVDADGDTLTYSTSTLPTGASFDVATQTFTWTPTFQQTGNYQVTFTVTDNGVPALSASEMITISVGDVNRAPVLASIGSQQVNENEVLSFTVTATDADNDTLTYSTSTLPTGASFDVATQTFSWTPSYEQTGSYAVTFTVTDDGVPALSASEVVTITVGDVNRAPVLAAIGNKQVNENEVLSFTVSATDADEDTLAYTATGLPTGASFDAATQTFSWTPSYTQTGTYQVTFAVTDDGSPALSASEVVTITVGDVNRAPVLTPIENKQVSEKQTLTFAVAATDADGNTLTYSATGLPTGASFDAATQTFSWTPTYQQAGTYQVTFTVTDNGVPALSDSETITVTVGDTPNTSPLIISAPLRTATKNQRYQHQLGVANHENDQLTYALVQGPRGMSLSGSGLLTWTPTSQGRYCVIVKVTENTVDGLSNLQHFCINVRDIERSVRLNSVSLLSESVMTGGYLPISVSLSNEGDADLEDVRVTATIYELGVRDGIGPFDVDRGDHFNNHFYLRIPVDVEPGLYDVRIVASNDEVSHVVHRIVEII